MRPHNNQPIFIKSSHASLEHDQARLFHDLGFPVAGDWDVGSKQRRKIPGVTDHNSDIRDFDFIVLHQVPDYCDVMQQLLDAGKIVVLSAFGQSDTWQYEAVGRLCRDYKKAYVTPYSAKDNRLYRKHGCPSAKVRHIRFGKYLEDFKPWTGEGRNGQPFAYVACNDIQNRGHGCGWELFKQVRQNVPTILSGKNTGEVQGLGEVTEEEMHDLMAQASCFLSFGTAPAPWVLTQMESWCAGTPVVIYNNGHGIAEESMPLLLESTVEGLVAQANRLISDADYRQLWHEMSMQNAALFDVREIAPQWETFIYDILLAVLK